MSIYDDAKDLASEGYNKVKDFFGGDEAKATGAGEAKPLIISKGTRLKTLEDKLDASKRKYNYLKFPLTVDTEATQNIFLININATSGSKYAGSQYKVVSGEEAKVEQAGSNSLSRKFSGNTVRIDTAIALYMPPTVQTSYQSNWEVSQLGAAGAIIDAFTGVGDMSQFDTYKNIWNTAKAAAPDYLGMTAAAIASALTPFNVKDAVTFYKQTVLNPYVEVIFNGVTNRTFTFTFKFIPRSQEEQVAIKKIVDTLKFHRAPEKKISGVNSIWRFPSTFDISFLNKQGQENKWLFKISTCALTNLDIQQGSDNHFASFEDGSPFSTTVTMSFTEMEVLTKERHLQGY